MKKMIIASIVMVAMLVPATVSAATVSGPAPNDFRGYCGAGVNFANAARAQGTVYASPEEMLEARKVYVAQLVADGTITEAQGDLQLERIEARIKFHQEYGYTGGMMRGFRGNNMGNFEKR